MESRARGSVARLSFALVLALLSQGLAHDLPTFPRVRLVGVWDDPGHPARRVLAVEVRDPTGGAPVIGAEVVVSGLDTMEYGTPFPRGLRLFHWDVPPIFFGREYLATLTVKHGLILAAVAVTAVMTRIAGRAALDGIGARTFRRLLVVNLLLVLAI